MECICRAKFEAGGVCRNCQTAYCKKESLSNVCPVCGQEDLKLVEEEAEILGGYKVLWLNLVGVVRIGLAELVEPPSGFLKIFESSGLKRTSKAFVIILCKDKKESSRFSASVSKFVWLDRSGSGFTRSK